MVLRHTGKSVTPSSCDGSSEKLAPASQLRHCFWIGRNQRLGRLALSGGAASAQLLRVVSANALASPRLGVAGSTSPRKGCAAIPPSCRSLGVPSMRRADFQSVGLRTRASEDVAKFEHVRGSAGIRSHRSVSQFDLAARPTCHVVGMATYERVASARLDA